MHMRKGRVEGKIIVVTGAAQGIGFACARMLAEEGASVVLSDIKQAEGEAAAARIAEQPKGARRDSFGPTSPANPIAPA
jgi:NAD(P)-dependent dehydrogenase (short-subunit alcohol dehydrogenase family)